MDGLIWFNLLIKYKLPQAMTAQFALVNSKCSPSWFTVGKVDLNFNYGVIKFRAFIAISLNFKPIIKNGKNRMHVK